MNKGRLVVISGFSGAGKGTVIRELMKKSEDFDYSVSATTRQPRPGETDGADYYFITEDRFREWIAAGAFLEYAEYCGNYYGTLKSEVAKKLGEKNVILEIEVEGAAQIRRNFTEGEAVFLFVSPPDIGELAGRLKNRSTETDESVAERLRQAEKELEALSLYDAVIINEDGQSGRAAEQIIEAVRERPAAGKAQIETFKNHFTVNSLKERNP